MSRILRDLANSTSVPRAADDESGSGPVEENARKKIANRVWVGSDGKEVDTPESATGVQYEFLGRGDTPADGKSYTRQFAEMSEAEKNMLAGFGAHTLMGNITNTWLGEKGDRAATAYDAIAERFELLNSGTWIDRTGAVGVKIDKAQLATAICNVLVASGKWTQAQVDTGGQYAKVLQSLEEDAGKVKAARQNPAIAAEYAKLVGRVTKSDDEVAGLFA